MRRHGGALLADPVGSGKTLVALAAANALRGETIVAALVPAPLREQWQTRAAACGVPIEILSHAEVSRGKLPRSTTRAIIIDESHHFREPSTCRYDHLCRFAVGRSMIAVTATPVVNRLEDIAHQLRLGVRDDSLRREGTPSLLHAMRSGKPPAALGDLVIASPPPPDLPARNGVGLNDDSGPPTWLTDLEALTLAGSGEVTELIRGVLLHAAGSSPAALHAALTRYRDLLRHAVDARAAGRSLDRAVLRRFTADAPEQLVLWELLPLMPGAAELPVEDLPRVEELRSQLRRNDADSKADRLAALVGDGAPTIVFTTSIATVHYLRDRLTALGPAWVTGLRAGWRHVTTPREQVFRWFAPGAPDVAPRILIASDVAAEGLDLQRASRIVHYDLPWTAMRVAQREGRALRLGAHQKEIEVITFEPPEWLESRIGVARTVDRKGRLPGKVGLTGPDSPWRWRQDLAAEWTSVASLPGLATIEHDQDAMLLVVGVVDDEGVSVASGVSLLDPSGRWSEDAEAIHEALGWIRSGIEVGTTDPLRARWRGPAAEYARTILRRAREGEWSSGRQSGESRALLRRLRPLLRRAARARHPAELARLESLIDFTARGHSAGEERQVATLLAAEDLGSRMMNDPGPRSGVVSGALRVEIRSAVIFSPTPPP